MSRVTDEGPNTSPPTLAPVEPTSAPVEPTPAPVEPTPTLPLPAPVAGPSASTRGGRARPAGLVQAQLAAAEVRARRCLRDETPSPLTVTLRAGAEPRIDGAGSEAARTCLRKALAAVTLPADARPRQHTFFAIP